MMNKKLQSMVDEAAEGEHILVKAHFKSGAHFMYEKLIPVIKSQREALKKLSSPFDEHQAYYRLGYDSEKEPGVDKIIIGARGEHNSRERLAREAISLYKELVDEDE